MSVEQAHGQTLVTTKHFLLKNLKINKDRDKCVPLCIKPFQPYTIIWLVVFLAKNNFIILL